VTVPQYTRPSATLVDSTDRGHVLTMKSLLQCNPRVCMRRSTIRLLAEFEFEAVTASSMLSTLIDVLRIFSLFKRGSRVGIGSIVISKNKNKIKYNQILQK